MRNNHMTFGAYPPEAGPAVTPQPVAGTDG